jgi:flagellar protein FlaH
MPTSISDRRGGEDKQILSTGNHMLDKKIANSLPLQSLTPIEGGDDTGKSVLTQQIMYGAMKQGRSVGLFTIKSTTKSFVTKIKAMSRDVSENFTTGYLWVFPHDVVGFKWNKEEMVNI